MNFYVFGVEKFILNSSFVKKKLKKNIVIIFYTFMKNFIKKYEG